MLYVYFADKPTKAPSALNILLDDVKQTNQGQEKFNGCFGGSQYIVTVMESCPTYESMYERLCCGESQTTN